MSRATNLLALLSLFLYPSGFWICELFFENDIVSWRLLRDTLKGVELIGLACIYLMPKTKTSIASVYALLVLYGGNMVDRVFFGVSVFVWTDILLLLMAAIVFLIKWKGLEIFTRRNNKLSN